MEVADPPSCLLKRDGNKKGLTRGSGHKSEPFDLPQRFIDDSDDSTALGDNKMREDTRSSAEQRDGIEVDGIAPSVESDTGSGGKLPDLDTIKDTVAAVRSQRGSKCESISFLPAPPLKPVAVDDDWAQIADAMVAIGGDLNRGSVYAKEFEQTFWKIMTGGSLPHHIGSWLSDIGLPQYEAVLEANGFDNLQFLNDSILEEEDLLDMDITEPIHREQLLQAIKELPHLPATTPSSVAEWLSGVSLPQYEATFRSAGFQDMLQVRQMKIKQFRQIIPKRGHAKRILASLQRDSTSQLQKTSSHQSSVEQSEVSSVVERRTSYKSEISVFVEASTNSTPRLEENRKSKTMSSLSSPVLDVPAPDRAVYLSQAEGINLRPPNEATNEVSVSAWRHPQDILINSCCNYQAYYLGSMLIAELKGVESTKEACAKMKRSTDSMKKIPTITLSINYTGVKFIDFKSKHEITEHEIQNISFASQDALDLSTFAYVTFDTKTGHHYCHVFRVSTMDMAYEIILTLGQAFEVAYQLILKEKSLKESS